MKHHKTCFYFGKEPCFNFYVMEGPHIPNIFRWWPHPMAISEIFTLKKLRLHMRLGGGGGIFVLCLFLICS